MIVGLPRRLPLTITSAMPARTAALWAAVGVLLAVSAAPLTASVPVTRARWHSALSRPKSATPVDGDTANCQALAPPTELSYTGVAGVPLAVPLASAKLCALTRALAATGLPVASTAAKLVLQTLSVTEKRPYITGYMAARMGPLPRPQWALCIW